LGSAALTAGVASFTVKGSSLSVGANTLTAVYTATGNFANSTGTVSVTITPPVATTTSLAAAPASIATTATTQITVTVKAASGIVVPTGSIVLTAGSKSLGSATLSSAGVATFAVTGSSLATGANTLTATFTANGNFGNSSGTTTVTVTSPTAATASSVAVALTPETSSQPGWEIKVQLQEQAGVATKVTGMTINGTDFSTVIAGAFGSAQLAAHGSLTANLIVQWKPLPSTLTFVFTGVDASGKQWSQTASVKTSGN
jgi:hypothetical protein